jgi:hypothetical protein
MVPSVLGELGSFDIDDLRPACSGSETDTRGLTLRAGTDADFSELADRR